MWQELAAEAERKVDTANTALITEKYNSRARIQAQFNKACENESRLKHYTEELEELKWELTDEVKCAQKDARDAIRTKDRFERLAEKRLLEAREREAKGIVLSDEAIELRKRVDVLESQMISEHALMEKKMDELESQKHALMEKKIDDHSTMQKKIDE